MTPESAPDADAMLLHDGEVLAFLMGTGPLEGHHFGERHGTRKGSYWWRTVIRERQRTDPENARLQVRVAELEGVLKRIKGIVAFYSSGYAHDCYEIARAALGDPQ